MYKHPITLYNIYKPTNVTLEIRGNMAASLRDIVSGCSPLVLYNCYKIKGEIVNHSREINNIYINGT